MRLSGQPSLAPWLSEVFFRESNIRLSAAGDSQRRFVEMPSNLARRLLSPGVVSKLSTRPQDDRYSTAPELVPSRLELVEVRRHHPPLRPVSRASLRPPGAAHGLHPRGNAAAGMPRLRPARSIRALDRGRDARFRSGPCSRSQ